MLPGIDLARERVPDGAAEFGEVASPHLLREHRYDRRALRLVPHAFERHHEKRRVVPVIEFREHDGAVGLEAELVVPARIGRIGPVLEIPSGIEGVVLEELEQGSMQLVGAALGHDVDMHTEVRAVLRGRAAGLDLDLRHRVRDRTHRRRGREVGGCVDAVERQAVLERPLAGAGETSTAAKHARCRAGKRPHVAASAERRLGDQALVQRFRDRGVVGVENDGFSHDLERFADVADSQRGIPSHDLVVRHLDAGRLERLETRKRDGDLVPAGPDELEVVLTQRVRDRLVRILRADVDGDDRRAGNHASAAVGDGADQRGLARQLRECASVEQHGKPNG